MKRIILLLIIALLIIPFASAWEPTENTKFITVWSGTKPITDSLSLKSASQQVTILKTATDTVMAKATYPYEISGSRTTFKILKYRCDEKIGACGYWVEATRNGKPVATNSPIWIMSYPIYNYVSDSYDEKSDTLTTTMKEDLKQAVEDILQSIVEIFPLGAPVTGTKE